MFAPAHLALFALLAAGTTVTAQELELEQASLLEQARKAALRYEDSLPDFLCTEVIRRSQERQSPLSQGRWRSGDTLTVKLTYFDHKEAYRLMEINGKPTGQDYLTVNGAVSTGEFGTRLYSSFDPRSHADFHWKGWTTLRKRRVARFSYRIAREDSVYQIRFDPGGAPPLMITVAYHGEVFVDEETHMVLRLVQQAEIPTGFPIQANDSTVDYDFAEVGGKRYLLPAHAVVTTRGSMYMTSNIVEFRGYRKFQADATITFDPPPVKQ